MNPEALRHLLNEADCLYSAEAVDGAIARIARDISAVLADTLPLVYCVMTGGLVFAGKLLPQLNFPLEASYVHATRYRGGTQGGELHWRMPPAECLQGRTVLLVDDILDEGATLQAIIEDCRRRGAERILTTVLVEKQHARKQHPELHCDFVGLKVPDRYVFGSGMDYQEYWRNAPGIYAVKEH